ncbi:MAG TPA: hypothetical protein VF174_07415 [Micromonosporaceae bacterium]
MATPTPGQYPRKVVSKRKMGILAHCFHITMTVLTAGLWGVVYWSRLRAKKTVTRFE